MVRGQTADYQRILATGIYVRLPSIPSRCLILFEALVRALYSELAVMYDTNGSVLR